MAANDCKHRMAGFDYVIVMDIDEVIIPEPVKGVPKPTYLTILRVSLCVLRGATGA